MGYFNRDTNNRGGRDNRGGGRGFGRSSDGPREMFKTVCSTCNKECEVPFRPTTGKPVYCSDCFERVGGRDSGSARPSRDDRQEKPSFSRPQAPRMESNNAQLEVLSAKLDKIIKLLEQKSIEVAKEVKEAKVIKKAVVKKSPKAKKTTSVKKSK